MDFLTFAGIFFFCLLIVEKLLLAPLDFLATFHLPYWISLTILVSVFAWLLGE